MPVTQHFPIGGKHLTRLIPPKSNRFVANVDTVLVQQIFDVAAGHGRSASPSGA